MINGENVIDFYIRYECLKQDIMQLEKVRPELEGIYEVFSEIKSKSGVRPTGRNIQSYFDERSDLIETIRFFNSFTVQRFGYDLNG